MKISYGNSRMEKKWKNSEISWEDFLRRVGTTQITTETVEEFRKFSKAQQDQIKDVGGYVAGHLKGGKRGKRNRALQIHADTGYGFRHTGDCG